MDEQKSLQVCGIIAGILVADDHIHPHEADFLRRVQARFSIPEETTVEPIGHEEAVVKMRELPEELRKETLELLVQAAAADGKIEIGERIFLDAVAKELSTSHDDLETMLQNAMKQTGS
jgi:uncharacterized tellurite resistance protein B-like protein